MPSFAQQLHEVKEALVGLGRYQDLALALRREKTKETLLWAGGRWDRLDRRFLDPDTECEPADVWVIDLEESQVDYTLWFAEFLRDFREGYPRDISAALVAGDRRGGKTFDAYYCQIAALVDVPLHPVAKTPAIGWTISKTYRERDELDDLMSSRIPREWYHPKKAPEHRYDFVHGSALRNLSADDPDSLKQGKVDWVLYNEVQKVQARGVVHGLYGTADRAGLCVMTANKPSARDSRGEWLYDLKEAIEDESRNAAAGKKIDPLGIKFFLFSSKKNTKIDQPARKRVGRIAALIDPEQAEADEDDGVEWRRPGDKALWEFDKHRHLHAVPAVFGTNFPDVTRTVLNRHEWGEWIVGAGIDFQGKPHIVCAVFRLFGDPLKPTYWFVDEHVELGRNLTEELFLEGFEHRLVEGLARPYTKQNLLWICDSSSTWQGPRHDFEGGERPSADVFEGDQRSIIPAQPPAKNSRTGRGRNPFVDERLQLANELLRQDRVRIDPHRCPWLAECAREALTKRQGARRKLVANQYAHGIDAFTYPIWRLELRPGQGGSTDISGFGGVKGFTRNPYRR
jgi:hypothetical protein